MGWSAEQQASLDSALIALAYYEAIRSDPQRKALIEKEYGINKLMAHMFALTAYLVAFNGGESFMRGMLPYAEMEAASIADIRGKLLKLPRIASGEDRW